MVDCDTKIYLVFGRLAHGQKMGNEESVCEVLDALQAMEEEFKVVSATMNRIREHRRTLSEQAMGPVFDAMVHVTLHEMVSRLVLACFSNDVVGCEALMRITRSFIKYKSSGYTVTAGVDRWFGQPVVK